MSTNESKSKATNPSHRPGVDSSEVLRPKAPHPRTQGSGLPEEEEKPALWQELLFGDGGISVFIFFPIIVIFFLKMAIQTL